MRQSRTEAKEKIQKVSKAMANWVWWLLAGTLSTLGGILALANPFAATLTVELLTGSMFMATGLMTLVTVFRENALRGRTMALLVGVGLFALGFALVANPLRGIVALTFVSAGLLIIVGLFRILFAFAPLARSARWPLLIAGVISLAIGSLIFANFPEASSITLGILLAIELISNGISLIAYAFVRRSSVGALDRKTVDSTLGLALSTKK